MRTKHSFVIYIYYTSLALLCFIALVISLKQDPSSAHEYLIESALYDIIYNNVSKQKFCNQNFCKHGLFTKFAEIIVREILRRTVYILITQKKLPKVRHSFHLQGLEFAISQFSKICEICIVKNVLP